MNNKGIGMLLSVEGRSWLHLQKLSGNEVHPMMVTQRKRAIIISIVVEFYKHLFQLAQK